MDGGDTRLVLIRHGESQAALDGIVHGPPGELGAVDAVHALSGWGVGSGFRLIPEHGSITEFHRGGRQSGPFEWALVRWSDAAHLEGVTVDA